MEEFIEDVRVAYGSYNNVVWVKMEKAAYFFLRYAEFLRRNGDADSAADYERYAARLYDGILLSAMKNRPDALEKWAYLDRYRNGIPKEAPDKKEWEEFKQSMSNLPWRDVNSE